MNYVYVIINRDTGFIYGVTASAEKAREIRERMVVQHPSAFVSVSCEPVL